MSCKKAQGYLAKQKLEVVERVDAKAKLGPADALRLARRASKVVVARGSRGVTFSMKKDPPDDETLLAHLLGPTGNLRAPVLRKGRTLLVGFNESAYRDVLGTST
jgi:arsenate reductase-like glutaredoxin family protein